MHKECYFSSNKNEAEAIKLLDIGTGRTCQPVNPREYSDTENRTIISSFFWSKHRNATDSIPLAVVCSTRVRRTLKTDTTTLRPFHSPIWWSLGFKTRNRTSRFHLLLFVHLGRPDHKLTRSKKRCHSCCRSVRLLCLTTVLLHPDRGQKGRPQEQ